MRDIELTWKVRFCYNVATPGYSKFPHHSSAITYFSERTVAHLNIKHRKEQRNDEKKETAVK